MKSQTLVLIAGLGALSGCIDGGFDGFDFIADGPFPVFQETTTSKKLTLTLDDLNPVQRYVIPATQQPSSFEAHFDIAVSRADSGFFVELIDDQFASDEPFNWAFADVGFGFRAASSGTGTDRIRLSVARQDVDAGRAISLDIDLTLAAPSDVDFDGIDDNVTVSLGGLEPVIPE
ncbi:MAG: hypothetical protein Q8O67_15215 [Deltaproteobacteria bacterium]|nr:hypothetical protein [Deltaproteobacteria bacterium]